MSKLTILSGLFLLVVAFAVVQQNRELTIERAWSTVTSIESITSSTNDQSGWQVRIGGSYPRDCAIPLQTEIAYYPNNIDIQLYRDIPSTALCGLEKDAWAIDFKLDPEAETTYLIVNDRVWEISAPSSEESDAARTPGFTELSRFPVHIDEAILRVGDDLDQYRLSVRGGQAVGCDLPEIYSLRQTREGILVGVFNALAAETACPDMLVEVDESISFGATDPPSVTLFAVNTFQINELEEQTVSDSDKVLTNIFRVDVNVMESDPRQISLEVEGEHPDGCEYPVLVGQTRQGNTIDIEVYREVPADVFCPMILKPYKGTISLDGAFESGAYTINVNSHSQAIDI